MSINAAGLHVTVAKGVTQKSVTRAVDAYFRGRGARRSDRGARSLPDVSVEDTGKLGVAVLPPRDKFIVVLDSERYSASAGLAAHLATKLKTEVLHWTVSGASDSGSATRFRAKGKPIELSLDKDEEDEGALPSHAAVTEYLVGRKLPLLFERFGEISELTPAERRAAVVMGFRDVTWAAYEGASEDDEAEDDGLASADQIAAWRDEGIAEGMEIWKKVDAMPNLDGLQRARQFEKDAPYGYSAGGQRYGLEGLVESLVEATPAVAESVLRRLLDHYDHESLVGGERTWPYWLMVAKLELGRGNIAASDRAFARTMALQPGSGGMLNPQIDFAVELFERKGMKSEAQAIAAVERARTSNTKKPPPKLAANRAVVWKVLSEAIDTVALASLDADSLGNQVAFAKGFGEMGAKRLAELEAELRRRKVS